MTTPIPVFQEVLRKITSICEPQRVRRTSVLRLALLVSGILAAESACLAQIAQALVRVEASAASVPSTQRRLRRTLADPRLRAQACYQPVLPSLLDWEEARQDGAALLLVNRRGRRAWARGKAPQRPLVLIVDESSRAEHTHLLRLSLAYRGGSLPLAWRVWQQQAPLPEGAYWEALGAILAEVAHLLPPAIPVVLVADRAYGTHHFVDLVAGYGWHWLVRATLGGQARWRTAQGQEQVLGALVAQHVPRPGRQWLARGAAFKNGGWRPATLAVLWARGQQEPLALLSDLPPVWDLLLWYAKRFWIEAGFRSDKAKGWHWEASQVPGLAAQDRLLVGMAWASLLVLCLGAQEAPLLLERAAQRRGRPEHARQSLFTLGLEQVRTWLHRRTRRLVAWRLPGWTGPSWNAQYLAAQAQPAAPAPSQLALSPSTAAAPAAAPPPFLLHPCPRATPAPAA